MTSPMNEKRPQNSETNKHCQTFVYNVDEISLETLLDPNFHPISTFEPRKLQQIYYKSYHAPQRSSSSTTQFACYQKASFDPSTDLPITSQPFSTIPTRRRRPAIDNSSIVHL